jgi:hypothetical protein
MRRDPVLVDLALQGGGAHGAFTWGVLDRLLEEPWLQIDGISGTSAGAMNATVLADGHAAGAADGARAALDAFWRNVSRAAEFSPLRRTPLDVLLGRWTLDYSPVFVAMDLARATRFWQQRRAQHLLYCGSCGSRLASVGRDCLACSAARGRGTCTNRKGIRRALLGELILDGLRQRLMAPELVEEFVAAFHNRQRREAAARAGKERELGETTRMLDKLIVALIEGYRTAGLQQRLEELEARKAALEQEPTADPPPPVRLRPNLAQVYRAKVERLHLAFADPGLRDEALGILRGLIEPAWRATTERGASGAHQAAPGRRR